MGFRLALIALVLGIGAFFMFFIGTSIVGFVLGSASNSCISSSCLAAAAQSASTETLLVAGSTLAMAFGSLLGFYTQVSETFNGGNPIITYLFLFFAVGIIFAVGQPFVNQGITIATTTYSGTIPNDILTFAQNLVQYWPVITFIILSIAGIRSALNYSRDINQGANA